jgi:hypothetical protein
VGVLKRQQNCVEAVRRQVAAWCGDRMNRKGRRLGFNQGLPAVEFLLGDSQFPIIPKTLAANWDKAGELLVILFRLHEHCLFRNDIERFHAARAQQDCE